MLILASTSDVIQVTLGLTNQVGIHTSYVDWDGTRSTLGRLNINLASTSTTTIVPAPSAGMSRNVKYLGFFFSGAGGNIINVTHTDGTTTVALFRTSWGQYGISVFTEEKGWQSFASGCLIAVQG